MSTSGSISVVGIPRCVVVVVVVAVWLDVAPQCGITVAATSDMDTVCDKYEVLIDGGTTGSKAIVYRIKVHTQSHDHSGASHHHHQYEIEEIMRQKVTPGLWTYKDDVEGLDHHLRIVLDYALIAVPEHAWSSTPCSLMASAGMRLILDTKADAIMDRVNEILSDPEVNPFDYSPHNTRILSGEEEGAFAWIAVNYLRGYFGLPDGDEGSMEEEEDESAEDSVGILELGGGSTQIAFIPEGDVLADKFPVTVSGKDYSLYVHSYLYYGQDFAARWVEERLVGQLDAQAGDTIHNPCMLRDDTITKVTSGIEVTFEGSGNATACEGMLHHYVYDVPDARCYPKPCAIGPYYQPAIPQDKQFLAIAAFKFYPSALKVIEEDGTFQPNRLREAAFQYCDMSLSGAQEYTGEDTDRFLSLNCLMSLYIPLLVTKGYGFPGDTTNIRATREVNDESPDWTIGAIIYENERRRLDCPDIGEVSGGAAHIATATSVTLLLYVFVCFCNRILHH